MMQTNKALPKIFVIGFNKCGTSSLHYFFKQNGLRSFHWGGASPKSNGALIVFNNLMLGRDLLDGIDHFDVYSDLSFANDLIYVEASRFFKEIHEQYPEAYFILNTRPVKKWLESRLNHGDGSLKERSMSVYNCSEQELRVIWKNQYQKHSDDVRAFFKRTRGHFLEFNIEQDSPEKLIEFLTEHHDLESKYWQRKNITKMPNT